jgi:hypothetical protein
MNNETTTNGVKAMNKEITKQITKNVAITNRYGKWAVIRTDVSKNRITNTFCEQTARKLAKDVQGNIDKNLI